MTRLETNPQCGDFATVFPAAQVNAITALAVRDAQRAALDRPEGPGGRG